ncbi:MAG: HD-GYP domain-containing protein [Gammaproteobacteria bacterium]|nr:HD-GYP domain-containing protein [Gammaproteobacteria bacterium]
MEKYIEVGQIELGMYVVRLDRPWLETPFMTQGFPVLSKKLIADIAHYCDHVYINTDEGIDLDLAQPFESGESTLGIDSIPGVDSTALSYSETAQEVLSVIETGQLPKMLVKYVRQSTFVEESETATEVYKETRKVVDHAYQCARDDKPIDAEQPKALVQRLVASVIRNPDAASLLANLKSQDSYTADHSMNVCMIALIFGRHLGLSEEPLNELGLGALLHDIGKMKTPPDILNKPGKLTDKEMNMMRYHPTMGRDLLMKSPGISDVVVDIAYSHHERQSGNGYPRGVTGDKVSLFSKMVAIVDVYDAITSDRCYHQGMIPMDALQNIYKWRGKHFDPYLAEQFIQCIGTYPVGSIVELSNQEVGIVVSVNQKKRLLPEVMLVRDKHLQPYEPVKYIDLAKVNEAGTKIEIAKVLSSDEHGIHIQEYIFNI